MSERENPALNEEELRALSTQLENFPQRVDIHVSASDQVMRMAAVRAAAAVAAEPYTVTFRNQTPYPLTVATYYVTLDDLTSIQSQSQPSPPNSIIVFVLTGVGDCQKMIAYVMEFFYQGQSVLRWPEDGVMTPQRASVLNPGDQEVCADSWSAG